MGMVLTGYVVVAPTGSRFWYKPELKDSAVRFAAEIDGRVMSEMTKQNPLVNA